MSRLKWKRSQPGIPTWGAARYGHVYAIIEVPGGFTASHQTYDGTFGELEMLEVSDVVPFTGLQEAQQACGRHFNKARAKR